MKRKIIGICLAVLIAMSFSLSAVTYAGEESYSVVISVIGVVDNGEFFGATQTDIVSVRDIIGIQPRACIFCIRGGNAPCWCWHFV